MNEKLAQHILEDDLYTNDDLSCFSNIQWEMSELLVFLKDCNVRKISYFKISLGILSVFVTGFGLVINAAVKGSPIVEALSFQGFVSVALIIMGLLTYTIIRELYSIHASRVTALRQMNCLRQSMDSIRFRKHEGVYPNNFTELRNEESNYWMHFGKHRKLPIENEELKKTEHSISRSPDMFMIIVLFVISLLLQFCGVIYLVKGAAFNALGGICIGVLLTLVTFYFGNDFKKSRKQLRAALGIKS